MPGSFFYVVRRRPGAVPGTAWVLLDPPPVGEGATDGHTIGILVPSGGAGTGGAEILLSEVFPRRPPIDLPRAARKPPDTRH